ncbi:hypothetical protein GCM10028808_04990 [Spirosoma migulaei]
MNKALLRRALPILLAFFLLWYVLKGVPFAEIGHQFQLANYGWLSLVGLLICLSYVLRAARWQLTLRVMGYEPSLFRSTVALLAGTVASMIVPGAGELTRCGTLQRTDDIPISQAAGSVVAERIMDLLMLALVLLLTVMIEFSRMQSYLAKVTLALPGVYVLTGVGLLVLLVFVGVWQLLIHPTLREHPLIVRMTDVIKGFRKGFMAIRKLSKPGLFITLTLLIQTLSWLVTYVLLLSTSDTANLQLTAALTILAVSSLGGLAVPTQGGIGTYHFLVSRALVLYGMTLTEGVIVATFLHAVQTGFALLLSSLSFLIIPLLITNRQKKQESNLVK